ncbi:hypothetical protein BDP27DRAFT_1369987 [Rhodocollybia butyracea]|uniref:DUF6532 domain-containing protein n=1 Tax=Rhodocollybia butyracea TaxID=206335 RepID=A0A9P5TZP5_9AGAR|nr:hypothetical protein BDP27DRAFT_1369987 [Rhodocollybia butyracea]
MDFGFESSLPQPSFLFASPPVPGANVQPGLQSLYQTPSHPQIPSSFSGQSACAHAPGPNPDIVQHLNNEIWNLQVQVNPLRTEIETWKTAYQTLAQSLQNSSGVTNWYHHTDEKSGGKSESSEPTCGASKASNGINVATKYVLTDRGTPINGHKAWAMQRTAMALLKQYLDLGKAPLTWGQVQYDVRLHFISKMVAEHPKLGLCKDFWKPLHLATTIYPSWHKNSVEKKAPKKRGNSDTSTGSCEKRSALHENISDSALPPLKKVKLGKGRQKAKVDSLLASTPIAETAIVSGSTTSGEIVELVEDVAVGNAGEDETQVRALSAVSAKVADLTQYASDGAQGPRKSIPNTAEARPFIEVPHEAKAKVNSLHLSSSNDTDLAFGIRRSLHQKGQRQPEGQRLQHFCIVFSTNTKVPKRKAKVPTQKTKGKLPPPTKRSKKAPKTTAQETAQREEDEDKYKGNGQDGDVNGVQLVENSDEEQEEEQVLQTRASRSCNDKDDDNDNQMSLSYPDSTAAEVVDASKPKSLKSKPANRQPQGSTQRPPASRTSTQVTWSLSVTLSQSTCPPLSVASAQSTQSSHSLASALSARSSNTSSAGLKIEDEPIPKKYSNTDIGSSLKPKARRNEQLDRERPQVNTQPSCAPVARSNASQAPSTGVEIGDGPKAKKKGPSLNHKVRRDEKLDYERPQVTTQSSRALVACNHTPSSDATRDTQWKQHSDIVVTGKNCRFTLALSDQLTGMREVINRAINQGQVHMLFNHQYSPIGPAIKQLAHASLSEAAKDLGYNYIRPIVNYVSGRIGIEQKELKTPTSTVLQSFGFTNQSDQAEARNLVGTASYLYPQDLAKGIQPDNGKPFQHPVFANFIREAFFSSGYYAKIAAKHRSQFRSSHPEKPNELEIPKAMVALASTAIHACLQDHSTGVKDNFPTKELDDVWCLAIRILDEIKKRSILKYHKLMHNLYIDASGSRVPENMTNQQIYNAIDWTAFNGDNSEDEGTSSTAVQPQPAASGSGTGTATAGAADSQDSSPS